jgi:hypothetical protein
MYKILVNKIQCSTCEDIIESKHRHDYVTCRCGRVSVDGGADYLKRTFEPDAKYKELSKSVRCKKAK